ALVLGARGIGADCARRVDHRRRCGTPGLSRIRRRVAVVARQPLARAPQGARRQGLARMLYQQLPRIEAGPLDAVGRWLAPALIAGAALTVTVLALIFGEPLLAGIAAAAGAVGVAFAILESPAAAA